MTHKTVIERVTEVENAFPRLVEAIDDNIKRRFESLLPALDAMVELIGRDAVMAKIEERRKEQQTQEMEMKKAQISQLVAQGRLIQTDKVAEDTVIVSTETDKDGNTVHPGRFQMMFSEVAPQYQEKLLGQGVGTKIEIQTGGTFEVLEIYKPLKLQPPAAIEGPVSVPNLTVVPDPVSESAPTQE